MKDKKTKQEVKGRAARGKIWVSCHYGDTDIDDQKELAVQEFDVEPAWIKAGYGLTINLGNYESARCDAGITLPTYVEEIPEAFKKAWAIAEEEIQEQVAKITKNRR